MTGWWLVVGDGRSKSVMWRALTEGGHCYASPSIAIGTRAMADGRVCDVEFASVEDRLFLLWMGDHPEEGVCIAAASPTADYVEDDPERGTYRLPINPEVGS